MSPTLTGPGELLVGVYSRHLGVELEPDGTRAIPSLRGLTCWNLGKVILGRPRVIDLLRGDVMDSRSGGDSRDIGGVSRLVATNIWHSRVLDALLALGVLRHAGDGPVRLLRYPVDDKSREGVFLS